VTFDCATSNDASVYAGALAWREEPLPTTAPPPTRTRIMLNVAQPNAAFASAALPVDGVGLARIEFIIGSDIGVHPMAFIRPDLLDVETRSAIAARHRDYADGAQFFVETLARGISMIAASQFPKLVIVRMSDFKTNEYARLLGGSVFEPKEENPMIGFRGASRYYDERYAQGFALECRAIQFAREVLGLTNIAVMIPFCRTPQEADRVLDVMAENGVVRGVNGLRIYVMCEVPSNVILAEDFAQRFDGFSIGSNDLTQLTLGVDRDSEILAKLFEERDKAVMTSIVEVIRKAHACGCTVGLCGQAPSDDPGFAEALVAAGIDSISVDPSSAIAVRARVAAFEAKTRARRAG
jgi:pyruvate,water dikinase